MKIDSIVKEELWRSTAMYFFFFMLFSFLDRVGSIPMAPEVILTLSFVFTAAHFLFMVWYRKKEQLYDPSIHSIMDHIFRSEYYEEKTSEISEKEKISILSSIRKNMRLLTITILLYIIYLYTSLVYHIDQIFWILIILFTGSTLSKIIYGGNKEDQKDPMRLLVFYVIACIFIFVRYLVLGYPIFPILKGSIILGALLVILVLGIRWSHRKQNSDN